jgi:cytochrome b involved in lipid metabolism
MAVRPPKGSGKRFRARLKIVAAPAAKEAGGDDLRARALAAKEAEGYDSEEEDDLELPGKEGLEVVEWAELAKHDSKDDLWVAIDGVVYDLTGASLS